MKIYSKISAAIIAILVIFEISGCSSLSSTKDSSKESLSANKSMSLITNNAYDEKIAFELEKQGFNIVTSKESRYQLETHIGNEIDWCHGKKSRKFDTAIFKLKDLTNEKIVFILESDGWSDKCELYQTSVFTKLAKRLSERWDSPDSFIFYSDLIYF